MVDRGSRLDMVERCSKEPVRSRYMGRKCVLRVAIFSEQQSLAVSDPNSASLMWLTNEVDNDRVG